MAKPCNIGECHSGQSSLNMNSIRHRTTITSRVETSAASKMNIGSKNECISHPSVLQPNRLSLKWCDIYANAVPGRVAVARALRRPRGAGLAETGRRHAA